MDITSSNMPSMGPPTRISPEDDTNSMSEQMGMGQMEQGHGNIAGPSAAAAAAAGAQQPKVVQTAFIHKLYK